MLDARRLGKRYGRHAALAGVDLTIPRGHVVGLVGPNGAGKSTLLQLACGLITPTTGTLTVLGSRPAADAAHLARVGFVAQDTPVYATFSVADHLKMGAWLNPTWDPRLAARRIAEIGLDPARQAGRLSGGQRAQLALTVAAAKRPELLIFDEPAAALDPLARQAFLRSVVAFVGELGASAILSSHLLRDVEQVCDYLVVLGGGLVQLAGPVPELLATHRRVTGDPHRRPAGSQVIWAEPGHALVRVPLPVPVRAGTGAATTGQVGEAVALEELVLGYLSRAASTATGGVQR